MVTLAWLCPLRARCLAHLIVDGAARSIQVFRIRDGKILRFRDYVNPNDLADALGA